MTTRLFFANVNESGTIGSGSASSAQICPCLDCNSSGCRPITTFVLSVNVDPTFLGAPAAERSATTRNDPGTRYKKCCRTVTEIIQIYSWCALAKRVHHCHCRTSELGGKLIKVTFGDNFLSIFYRSVTLQNSSDSIPARQMALISGYFCDSTMSGSLVVIQRDSLCRDDPFLSHTL